MAISVDWDPKIINVPRADMQLVQSSPTEIRQLDLDAFRLELKSLEASVEGMPFLDTHVHNTTVTVGGVTLARVVQIINGYTVTFEDGQYAVNLVGANSNVADVTNVNQVSIRSANSAGLTFSEQINNQSFEGAAVWIDTLLGLAGTQFPRGTPTDPVNNIDDALAIAAATNLRRFRLRGTITLPGSFEDYVIESMTGHENANVVLNSQSVDRSKFIDVTLIGAGSGAVDGFKTRLNNVSGISGEFANCGIVGIVTPGTGSKTTLVNCYSEFPGLSRPVIDMVNGAGDDMQIRGWLGGLTLRNIDQPTEDVSIDVIAGTIELDSSCTGGTVVVRGVGVLIDGSNGTTVNDDGWVQQHGGVR